MCKRITISVVVTLAIFAGAFVLRLPSYDMARVDPGVRSLQKPLSVVAMYYEEDDGIGISIIDRSGQELLLAIPLRDSPTDPRHYHRLFAGCTYLPSTNAVEVPFTEDTRRHLADIVYHDAVRGRMRERVLIALRGAPRDYVEVYCSDLQYLWWRMAHW